MLRVHDKMSGEIRQSVLYNRNLMLVGRLGYVGTKKKGGGEGIARSQEICTAMIRMRRNAAIGRSPSYNVRVLTRRENDIQIKMLFKIRENKQQDGEKIGARGNKMERESSTM